MAALQEALESLGPISWDEVPASQDALREYLNDLSSKARLIIDSVPEPPSTETSSSSNLAPSSSPSSRVSPSPARLGTPDPTVQSLQREWGKPIKTSNARDNPLELLIHKLPGRDGHGAWFARRSVHEGLSFSKWQAKLSSEMMQTLKANRKRLQKGRTPDQSVRGIGAEEHVEEVEVRDEEGRRVGVVNVFHVSAQFPKPTTPRDFVALIINWETGVDGGRYWMMVSKPCLHPDVPPSQGYIRGQYESVEFIREIPVKGGKKKKGLGGAVGSKESVNEEAEGKRGRKRGDTTPSQGPGKRGKGEDTKTAVGEKQPGQEDAEDDEDSNPVEWVMVTRSDPGGTIPRWMVEKGTPKSICTDAGKFLDWACKETDPSDSKEDQDEDNDRPKGKTEGKVDADHGSDDESDESDLSDTEIEHHGLIASFAYLLNAGLDRYAPQAVLDYLPRQGQLSRTNTEDSLVSQNDKPPRSSADSATTPASPPAKRKDKDESETRSQTSQGNASAAASIKSGLATPLEHDIQSLDVMMAKKGKLTSHEKQLIKLAERKRDTEAQLERVRSEIQSLHLPPRDEDKKRDRASSAALASVGDQASDQVSSSSPASSVKKGSSDKGSGEKSNNSSNQARQNAPPNDSARMHKVASGLFNEEAKLVKQLGKLNRNQLKEASKIEARQRKDAEREVKTRARTEVETLRQENEQLKKELERFRNERKQWVNLVGSLQAENTKLTAAKQSESDR